MQDGCNKLKSSINQILSLDEIRKDEKRQNLWHHAPLLRSPLFPEPCARAHLCVSFPCRMASLSHWGYFQCVTLAHLQMPELQETGTTLRLGSCPLLSVSQIKYAVRNLVFPSPRCYRGEFGLRYTYHTFRISAAEMNNHLQT